MGHSPTSEPFAVLGYFGYGNAGDDIILEVLLEQFPQDHFAVLAPPGYTGDDGPEEPRLSFVNRWNFFSLAGLFQKSRGLIVAGGELFQTKTSVVSFLYYAAVIFLARTCGCPLFVASMGVDPELPRWALALARGLMRGAKYLAVRDDATKVALGRGTVAPDPAWLWPKAAPAAPRELKRVLWILRPAEAPIAEARQWSRVLNDVNRQMPDLRHGFLALHPAHDQAFLTFLRLDLCFFHTGEQWGQLRDIETIIGAYDAVLSMRYHGLLLAARLGRPVAALARHPKVKNLAGFLGAPCVAPGDSAPVLLDALMRSWHRRQDAAAAQGFYGAAAASFRNLEDVLSATPPV